MWENKEYLDLVYVALGIGTILFIIAAIRQYLEYAKSPKAKAWKQIQKMLI